MLFAIAAQAQTTRPRYGGALRVGVQERVTSFAGWNAGGGLTYETLVTVDDKGQPVPALAASWRRDAPARWTLHLRPGVRAHDGSLVSASAVAAALQSALPGVTFSARQNAIAMAGAPLEALAAAAARLPMATGPYRVERFEPGVSATLAAFEDHWAGRPFVDAIDVRFGRAPRELAIDLELGRLDVAELAPADARRMSGRAALWSSQPSEVWFLEFSGKEDPRVREAVGLAVDRAAIHAGLLQRQGEASAALLPAWLSGLAHLFPAARQLSRAREIVTGIPASLRGFAVAVEDEDAALKPLADRIVLNAREAGLTVSPAPLAWLRRRRIPAAHPAAALFWLARVWGGPTDPPRTPEELYQREAGLIESARVIPLFHLPDVYGASARVARREPAVSAAGELRLADVWVAP